MPSFRLALALSAVALASVHVSAARAQTPWTFVSIPDFLNVDTGDLTAYDPMYAGPNRLNPSWDVGIDAILDVVAAENPDYVLVAGDLLMARWINDGDPTAGLGIFGPVRASNAMVDNPAHPDWAATLTAENARVDEAADFYYAAWKARFANKGLTVYPALGDHEIGDDPTFNPSKDGTALGRATIQTYRDAFARHITDPIAMQVGVDVLSTPGAQHAGTAYSVVHKNVMLINVDTFRQANPSDPFSLVDDTITPGDGQLAWINQQLAAAAMDPTIDHVIVQGHAPVIFPVAQRSSGGHHFVDGPGGAFWQALISGGADLYLCGEVHAPDVKRSDDLMQISHGSLIGRSDMPDQNFVVGTVYDDRIEIEIKYIEIDATGSLGSFFQPGMRPGGAGGPNEFRETLLIDPDNNGVQSLGRIVIETGGSDLVYRDGTGVFAPFNDPSSEPGVTNPSFELDDADGGTTAEPNVTAWFEVEGGDDLGASTQGAEALAGGTPNTLPDAPDGLNWLNIKAPGTAVYQAVAVRDADPAYRVQFVAGDRSQRQWDGVAVQLWAGNGTGSYNTAVGSFATLIDEVVIDDATFAAAGIDVTDGSTHTLDVCLPLDASTATTGETLWLQFRVVDTAATGPTSQHLVDTVSFVRARTLGDLDGDGDIDFDDFATFTTQYNEVGSSLLADLDESGAVDGADFATIGTNFGK